MNEWINKRMNERIFGRLLVMQRIKTFTRFNALAAFKTVRKTTYTHTHTHTHTHARTHTPHHYTTHTHAPVTHIRKRAWHWLLHSYQYGNDYGKAGREVASVIAGGIRFVRDAFVDRQPEYWLHGEKNLSYYRINLFWRPFCLFNFFGCF